MVMDVYSLFIIYHLPIAWAIKIKNKVVIVFQLVSIYGNPISLDTAKVTAAYENRCLPVTRQF